MKRFFYRLSEFIRSITLVWKWPRRLACHGNIYCCQYTDRPNDNNPSRWR
jgi:hypothetical protein